MFGESEPPSVFILDNSILYWENVACFCSNILCSLIGSIFMGTWRGHSQEIHLSTPDLMLEAAWKEPTVFSGKIQ